MLDSRKAILVFKDGIISFEGTSDFINQKLYEEQTEKNFLFGWEIHPDGSNSPITRG